MSVQPLVRTVQQVYVRMLYSVNILKVLFCSIKTGIPARASFSTCVPQSEVRRSITTFARSIIPTLASLPTCSMVLVATIVLEFARGSHG